MEVGKETVHTQYLKGSNNRPWQPATYREDVAIPSCHGPIRCPRPAFFWPTLFLMPAKRWTLAQKPFFISPTASLRRQTAKLTFRYQAEVFFEPPIFFHSVDFSIHQNRPSRNLVRRITFSFHRMDFSIHQNRLSWSLVRTILLFHRVDFSIHPNRLSRSLVRTILSYHSVDSSIHWKTMFEVLSKEFTISDRFGGNVKSSGIVDKPGVRLRSTGKVLWQRLWSAFKVGSSENCNFEIPPSLQFLGAIKEVQEHPQLEVNGGINTYSPLIWVLSSFVVDRHYWMSICGCYGGKTLIYSLNMPFRWKTIKWENVFLVENAFWVIVRKWPQNQMASECGTQEEKRETNSISQITTCRA